jgi:hypothetical protein
MIGPGRASGAPNTNSAAEIPEFSRGAALSPSMTHGRCENQSLLAKRARRASLSWRWKRSTATFACGWKEVVILCLIPNLAVMAAQKEEVNCTPLSEVTTAGTPYLATHPAMNASAQSAAAVALSGKASAQRVDLSITVSRCVNPSLVHGRGPTRSRCT